VTKKKSTPNWRLVVKKDYYFKDADEKLKRAVWEKGEAISGEDSNVWRRDIVGHKMKYSEHGNMKSSVGWHIDHIFPVSRGGTDNLKNLQPLYWKNNIDKGDQFPWPDNDESPKLKAGLFIEKK